MSRIYLSNNFPKYKKILKPDKRNTKQLITNHYIYYMSPLLQKKFAIYSQNLILFNLIGCFECITLLNVRYYLRSTEFVNLITEFTIIILGQQRR